MRVIEISSFGGPEVLQLAERPDPPVGKGEVLIDVDAAGINRPDVVQRLGKYPPPPGASDIPGLEVAGTGEGRSENEKQEAGANAHQGDRELHRNRRFKTLPRQEKPESVPRSAARRTQ